MLAPVLLFALTLAAQKLPVGEVIADVRCEADASQGYALYLPSGYTPNRTWPILIAFDPGARGIVPVERYRVAAERYGWIVVGSNNSRNGLPEIGKVIGALQADVRARFRLDPARVYTTGHSGGARVAMAVGLSNFKVTGVIASSAGYPDSDLRQTLPFVVFATAGTEDFNHLEMRLFDAVLSSPHLLRIFEGGHTWPPADLAMEAIEWMEVQAFKSGLVPRSNSAIEQLFRRRIAQAEARSAAGPAETYLALRAIASDFERLTDISAVRADVDELSRNKKVRDAVKEASEEDERERRAFANVLMDEQRLAKPEERAKALSSLAKQWKTLSGQATQTRDSSERRVARRVLSGLATGATTKDPDYLKIIAQYRGARRP